MKSADSGSSWKLTMVPGGAAFSAIHASSATNAWAVANGGGIAHTSNGVDWSQTTGVTTDDLLDVVMVGTNTVWAVGWNEAIVKTTDGGNTWQRQYPWPAEQLWGIDAIDSNMAWAVGQYGLIFHTTNGGVGDVPQPYFSYMRPERAHVGERLDSYGAYFGATRNSSYVSFGSVPATYYIEWSDRKISCLIPDIQPPATLPVTVTTSKGVSNPRNLNLLLPAPTVTSINPTSGNSVTLVFIEITGTGFQNGATASMYNSYYFGSGPITPLMTVVNSSTQMTCLFFLPLPTFSISYPMGDRSYYVGVANPDGQGSASSVMFLVRMTPCGGGSAASVALFGAFMGLLSISGTLGLRWRRRRR